MTDASFRSAIPLILRATSRRSYDLANTLVIAGSPRSGTTWLAELVQTIPRTAILFEPEHLTRVAAARDAGLSWHTSKEPGESWPEGDDFFARVLRGEILTPWTTSLVPWRRAIAPHRWIVKLVDANFLLGWLAGRFPIAPPLLLLRHPCAVVASQLRMGWAPVASPQLVPFLEKHPPAAAILDSLGTPVEFSAALWCMQTLSPLLLAPPRPILVVTYEMLVRDPTQELAKVFRTWNLPIPEGLKAAAGRWSATTNRASVPGGSADPRTSWQTQLTNEQVESILRVVHAFGIDFYSDATEPDLQRLERFGLPTPIPYAPPTSRP